jgi:hypothetical protein
MMGQMGAKTPVAADDVTLPDGLGRLLRTMGNLPRKQEGNAAFIDDPGFCVQSVCTTLMRSA